MRGLDPQMQLFLSTADMGCGPCSFKRRVVMMSPTLQEALLTRKAGESVSRQKALWGRLL